MQAGAKPVFVDISNDLNIDISKIEKVLLLKQKLLFQFIGQVKYVI